MPGLQPLLCALILYIFSLSPMATHIALDGYQVTDIDEGASVPLDGAGGDAGAGRRLDEAECWKHLQSGKVLVDSREDGRVRYVVSRILIKETPAKVWQVLVNPFEFEGKISPRMTRVEVLHDAPELSILRCRFEIVPPIPSISYDVESQYQPVEHVSFHRIGGAFKDFRGFWGLKPHENGASTEVIYSMYIDTGLPIPQWIVRKAVKMELPRTLIALRQRIQQSGSTSLDARTIKAARLLPEAMVESKRTSVH